MLETFALKASFLEIAKGYRGNKEHMDPVAGQQDLFVMLPPFHLVTHKVIPQHVMFQGIVYLR